MFTTDPHSGWSGGFHVDGFADWNMTKSQEISLPSYQRQASAATSARAAG